ncbi:MAG: hypothetical protein ABI772_12545, partial [Bacteroidota bacterium]
FSLGSILSTGQTEGIAFTGNNRGYITNETLLSVPPQLKEFDLNPYLTIPTLTEKNNKHNGGIFPGAVNNYLSFTIPQSSGRLSVLITNSDGQVVYKGECENTINIYTGNFSEGSFNCIIYNGINLVNSFSFIKIK